MPRIYALALVVAVLLALTPGGAHAQGCAAGAFTQFDMAGTYEAEYMRLVIYPCGGVSVAWNNAYGTHAAAYVGFNRLAGNGIMARGLMPDPMAGGYLDDSVYLGIKAAEPGWVEMGTYGPSPDPYNMPVKALYRLRKMS